MASSIRPNIPTIKMEGMGTSSGDSTIKAEPDPSGPSPGGLADEDIYEDAGDLDFAEYASGVFLARIPKYLWKTWSELEDSQEIHVGTLRVEGDMESPKSMSLLLSSNTNINHTVPKEYDLQISNNASSNTFVFTEKDLPGYSSKIKFAGRQQQDKSALPFSQAAPRLQLQDRSRGTSLKVDKTKRLQSNFRRVIPKKTSLVGKVKTEINCLPVENDHFRQIMQERSKREFKPIRETMLLSGPASSHAGTVLNPSTAGPSGNLENFIKTSAPSRNKGQDNKTARIPQNELMDLIYGCFKEFKYWRLKDLRTRLKQPETYLKQTLELVAQLVRTGPQAMTWQLKPEFRMSAYAEARDALAPESILNQEGQSDTAEGLGSEDEDNVKMEDALP